MGVENFARDTLVGNFKNKGSKSGGKILRNQIMIMMMMLMMKIMTIMVT